MEYSIWTDMQIQSKVEDSIKEIEEKYNIKINMGDWTWEFDYENIKKECYKILDELNKTKIQEDTISRICEPLCSGPALFDQNIFKYTPKYIKSFGELIEYIKNGNYADPIRSTLCFMEHNKKKNINIFEGGYWIYQDGVNWETWIDTQDGLIKYIKTSIDYCEEEELEEIYKILIKEEL